MAYNSLSPIGGERGDIQAAIVSSTIANSFRGANSQPATVAEYKTKWGAEEEEVKEEFYPVTKAEAEEFLKQVRIDGNS